jgi:CDP-diacylglycerol---glycerol-3-phosphate 3-phosphatidyltransferase
MSALALVDLVCGSAVLVSSAAIVLAYAARCALRGRVVFERVAQAGQSVLLGFGPMNAFYWALQPVARGCVALGVGANAVTIASLGLAAGAGLALASGHTGTAALLAALSSLGDALDGLVARRTRTASEAGEVLDAAVDRYGELFFLSGAAVRLRHEPWMLVATLAAIGGGFMVSYASAKAEALHLPAPRGTMRRPERAAYLTLGATLAALAGSLWPLVAAISLVALVANASAVARLRWLATAALPPRPHRGGV